MHNITKIVVAVLVIALIAVIGLIWITRDQGASESAAAATAQPEATAAPAATADAEGSEAEENQPAPTATPVPADSGKADEANNEALDENAQGTMYEGALAGLTEEEIAKLAMAEENAMHAEGAEIDGAEGAVD